MSNPGLLGNRAAWRLILILLLSIAPAAAQTKGAEMKSARPGTLPAELAGQVEDLSGAIIPNAVVELRRPEGGLISKVTTDSAGQFHLPLPSAGDYQVAVSLPGFQPLVRTIRAGSSPLAPLTLRMSVASLETSVTVNADEVDAAAPENNQDAATISSNDMKSLPILDGDVVNALSAFLDAGASGEGGATLIVDGVEMKSAGVAPSAIDRVSINENPYSAQYNKPGRGQIEIITKQTADKFHGSATFTFRDSIFDATNYFATSKPPTQRRTYEGFLTGPIRPLPKTTFLFSIFRQEQNLYQQVNATTSPGVITNANVFSPVRNSNLTMKVAHQLSDHHSEYLLYRFFDTSIVNQGTGGLTLASAGFDSYRFDMDITFHDDDALAPNKLNQFNILFERNIDRNASARATPAIVVQGAFAGGGAQNDSLATENNPNISDIFSWTVGPDGMHQLKFGVQLPNLGRRVLEDFTNRQGTYTFASLAAYQANTPVTYTLQQGQTRFLTHFDQPGAFFLDQMQVTPRLTVTPGVRYDFQNALPGTIDAIQPKLALAYLADKRHALVLRTGGGIYMRRVGVNIGQQLARYQYAAERSLLLTTNLCYPDITACNSLAAQPPSLFNFQAGIHAPFQAYFGMSAERQITAKSTFSLGYEGYRGWHALRSIDINAPPPPFTSPARPNPAYAAVLQLQSGGIQRSDAMIASYRGRISHYYSGFAQYTWQHSAADTEYSTFSPQNQYDPNDEYGRTNQDQRQRLSLFGTFYPDKPLNLGLGFYANTPSPYTITTGTDDFHTGILNARPAGIGRNTLNGGAYQDIQLRLGYTARLRPKLKDASPTLAISLASFNTLNRVNYEDYIGVITSPYFMKPTTADSARRMQLSVGYTF